MMPHLEFLSNFSFPLGRDVLTSLTVSLGAPKARFSAAVDPRSNKICVSGVVRDGKPFLARIGNFDVDVTLEVGLQGLAEPLPRLRSRMPAPAMEVAHTALHNARVTSHGLGSCIRTSHPLQTAEASVQTSVNKNRS